MNQSIKLIVVFLLLLLVPQCSVAQGEDFSFKNELDFVKLNNENELNAVNVRESKFDDYARFLPISSVFLLKACGMESASSWRRLAVNSASGFVISCGTAYALKHIISKERPDGSDNRSFPSGHATVAFAGATVLHKEFHHVSPWISVAGYGVATLIAIDRVRLDRHDWLDVTAGALIGIAGVEAGYWIGDKITGEHSRYNVSLSPTGLSLLVKL